METTSIVPSPVDVPARLSSAQKRDLLGQAVAAVITTALIAAPLITPPSGGADAADGTLPAQSFAGAVTAVAVTEGRRVPRQQAVARPRAHASGRLMAAAVPAIALQPQVVGTSGYTRAGLGSPSRSESRRPLSRKLTGWLTGDGTHTVRPFPTLAGGRP